MSRASCRGTNKSAMSDTLDEDDDEPVMTNLNPIGLSLKELQKLRDKFLDEDGNPVKLNKKQFVEAFSLDKKQVASKDRDHWHSELCTLFNKIDAQCMETVDWNEFTNYMLLLMPGYNSAGSNELPQQQGPPMVEALLSALGSGHVDMINSIIVVSDAGDGANSGNGKGPLRRYVTAGRDGVVKVWNPNLQLHRSIDVAGGHKSWLSSCCWMNKSRRLAIASSRFKIYFYDSSFNNTALGHIEHKEGTPLCLGYHESNESNAQNEMLMVGDTSGCVTVYPLTEDWTEHSAETPIAFSPKPLRRQYHTDWVTKVGFVSELQAMVTCGLDGDINCCDVHANRTKDGRGPIPRLHKKGVHTWCWCKSYKFFASGGLDRQVVIWNPYTQKPMNHLQGHNASILDILMHENQSQLISLSVDKVVKVWDIRNYRCIQTFTDKTEYKPEDRLTCMAFDEEGPALILCSSSMNVLPVNVHVETSRTHMAPIVGALYNDVFRQVVSGDHLGTICVWDVRTGKMDFEFRVQGDHKVTCMAFDESKRRLFTGAEDGVVKLWNFSSGQLLRTHTMPRPSEITGLLWAREGNNTFVVGLAWDHCIYVWPFRSDRKQHVDVQYVLEDKSTTGPDDISCICGLYSGNGQLATGGDDGCIIFWKIQEGNNSSLKRYRLCDTTPATGSDELRQRLDPKVLKKGAVKSHVSIAGNMDAHGRRPSNCSVEGSTDRTGVALGSTLGLAGSCIALGSTSAAQRSAAQTRLRNSVQATPSLRGTEEVPVSTSPGVASETFLEGLDETPSVAVERIVFLEHKHCIISTHADHRLRVWSTKRSEFLHRLELVQPATESSLAEPSCGSKPRNLLGFMNAQVAPITSIYVDAEENRWMITGDSEGYVRIWDLQDFAPGSVPSRHLLKLHEFQPHVQKVTHVQHFSVDGLVVVMSASADGTIALSMITGQRIGTFNGALWSLTDHKTFSETRPVLDDMPMPDAWTLRGRGRNVPSGCQGAVGSSGHRTPRVGKVLTQRNTSSSAPSSGNGTYKRLVAVDRHMAEFDIPEQEKLWQTEWQSRQSAGNVCPREHVSHVGLSVHS